MRRLSLLAVLSLSAALCACAPHREVTPDQVQALTKLTDVMDAQSTYADPLFAKRNQKSFSDAEFASMVDASARLQATSLKAKDFSKGPGFDALAVQLHDQAAALGAAGQSKDAAAASKALSDMKHTCKECHSRFR
ncbi:MAG: cytochrome c [Polyangia bacterium]